MFEIRHGFYWWFYTDRLPTILKKNNINTLSVNHTTILASLSNYLATKAFIIKSYWTHQQAPGKEAPCLLYKKQAPSTFSWNQKRRALSKHSGNAPVAKRWTNQVLPLKGLPITRIPACQSGSSAPRLGTNGKRMAKRHKYGTYRAWMGGGAPGTWGRSPQVTQGIYIRV